MAKIFIMTTLSKSQVNHLSTLAYIPLVSGEISSQAQSISKFLDHVLNLQQLSLQHTPTTNQVTNKTNVFREDIVKPSLSQTQALSGAAHPHNGYFLVDAVIFND